MLNWFKKKCGLHSKKMKITLRDAKNIRDAKIKIAPDTYFDLFGDPVVMYKTLYSDALITLAVHHVLSRSELPYDVYLDNYNDTEVSYIADEIVEAWADFFPLAASVRQKIKLIQNLQKAQQKLDNSIVTQIGNLSTQHLP